MTIFGKGQICLKHHYWFQWVLRYVGHLVQAKTDFNDFISTVLLRL